jgi:hypothetical protein
VPDTAFATITIQPFPDVNAGNDSIVCNNSTAVQFTAQPAGGIWSGTNVSAAGLFNPQASGNGTYTLNYSATLNGCTKVDSMRVTVIDPPMVNAGADATVCQDISAMLRLNGNPSGGRWSGSGQVTDDGLFSPSVPGVYTLIYSFGAGSLHRYRYPRDQCEGKHQQQHHQRRPVSLR